MGAGRAGRGRRARDATPTCGQLLQRYRVLAGLTQEELAERAGYSGNYIGKLEQDQRELPAAAADRLAAVLGLADQDQAALRAARERRQGGRQLPARQLAGRDAEMAQIRQFLAGAGPPVLLLAGEPGMGKTRLLEEAASRAAGGGWGVAQGGCLRRAQDAYAPLSGALDDALQRLPDGQRAEALRQAGRLDLLLPELAPPGGPGPGEGEVTAGVRPEQQRRLLVSSAGRLLRAVAGPAGTLLVLDDLHWAGPDAVDLLAALLAAAGSPPLRVIGAYRDSETPARLDECVADLARASLVRVLPLGPLTDADAGRLLLQLAPEEEQQPTVLPAIVRRAGGVPFFLISYAEQVRGGGGQGGASLAVPWTVAQVIGQRVAALPGPAKELLSVAAVAGQVVPYTLLAQVTSSDDEQVLEAVETALEARLLAEDGPDGYRFTHDLIRETVEDGLSAARRRRLHRRIAQALEHQPGASAEALAFHFSHSGEDGAAAGYLELAGDQAQQRVAYAAAAEFYAAAAARLQAAGRPAKVVPVTEKQGVASYRAGRYDAAITALEGALAGYRAVGDAESVARLAGRLANAHYRRGTGHDALGELADMTEGDPALASGAASPGALTWWEGLLLLLYAEGSYTKMVTLGRSLGHAGRAADNSQMQAIGTRVEGGALIHLGRLAEGAALMAAALSADPQPGDERAVQAAALLSAAYLAMGSVDHCAALSERMLAAAERDGDQLVIAMHTAMLAGVCYVRGDWDRGRDLVGRALECFAATTSPMAVRAVGVLAPVLIWHGAWDQARAYLEGSMQAARSLRIVQVEQAALTHLADLDLLDGRPQDAVTRLHPVTADRPLPAVEDLTWDTPVELLSVLAEAHLEVDDLDRARAYAGRAVDHARRMGAWVQGIRALEVRGMVLARDGDHDLARAAYQEGLDRARAMPFPYGQARLLHACGLLDRQQQDHAAAHAKFAQALAILERLGADKDADRLRRAIADTPPRQNPPGRTP
jgi:tetratricopeptide (TPR) repeat protein/transcriptional regulator with XRE-family HTH domain